MILRKKFNLKPYEVDVRPLNSYNNGLVCLLKEHLRSLLHTTMKYQLPQLLINSCRTVQYQSKPKQYVTTYQPVRRTKVVKHKSNKNVSEKVHAIVKTEIKPNSAHFCRT